MDWFLAHAWPLAAASESAFPRSKAPWLLRWFLSVFGLASCSPRPGGCVDWEGTGVWSVCCRNRMGIRECMAVRITPPVIHLG